jgi:hypothetical protein
MWNPKFLIGFTDTETVKLDLDETSFKDVKDLAKKTEREFNLNGFLILRSSRNNYHVIFDCKVGWSKNVSIMAYAIHKTKKPKLLDWFLCQCRREASTLRVSSKGDKKPPRIVFRSGEEDTRIKAYLISRREIKRFLSGQAQAEEG